MSTTLYDELVQAGANLAKNEFWCVVDPGGLPMVETKSKRFDVPVIMFCDALNCDWEDAKDIGYRIDRVTLPVRQGERS